VAELIDVKNAEGQYPVAGEGIAEVVADKGYHSNQTMIEIKELGLRTYVAEPDRGPRNWDGKAEERDAVYASRRRINGERCKRLQSQRGEKIERETSRIVSIPAAWIGCIYEAGRISTREG
jgi:IS5 family transposase